jgi:hypothetical protein
LQLVLEFILQLSSIMQQYQYLKLNPFQIRHCAASLGVENRGNCCAFRATTIDIFVFTPFLNEVNVVIHNTHLIGNTHTKKDNTRGIEETTLNSFRNGVNTKPPIVVARKAHLCPLI